MRRPVESSGFFLVFVSHWFFSRRVATVAAPPSALFDERFLCARCKLGVLVSAGAATSLSTSVPSLGWKRAQAINSITGTPLWAFAFPFEECSGFMQPPASLCGCCCARVRRLLHSPTNDAATRQTSATAIMAHFFPLFPPRSASFRPQWRRSLSTDCLRSLFKM
jgi:hypothetical protein